MTSPTTKPTCVRCGEPITPGARFCMKCGSDVSGEQGGVPTAMMPAAKDENEEMLELLRKATLGDYEILRELGRGGMATVYLAHDIALDRKVALKVMSPALALMGEGMAERFKREARTAASLSHPNIIPIFAVKSHQKTLFFVMKFIAGRSLESLIKDMGPMPVEMVRDILQQVGTALGYAHRNGIVHRDVKPANIMIDEEGWSVVTDFGIAKVAENRGLTMTGIAVGTPSYMSPEQCAAKDITGKSDQYSLGVVAYEMLTGKQPFEGDSAMAIMFAHFHEAPRPVRELRADIPEEVATTVMRMLEKPPEKRWATIEDAIGAMDAEPLAHDDPTRIALIKAVRAKSNRVILDNLTPPPTSPVPPVKRPSGSSEAATTPIPAARIVGVTITPTTAQLHPGETRQLIATPRVASGTTAPTGVLWHSANPAIATVLPSGLVTAIAEGKVEITAKVDGVTGTCSVEVVPVPVSALTLDPEAPRLQVDATATLKVTVSDAQGLELTDRKIKWSISPAGIAKVSDFGVLTGIKAGKAEVTAECEGVKGVARLEVIPPPVTAIAITPTERTVSVGDTASFSARLTDASGKSPTDRTVTWTSEGPAIVAVSARGIVTGLTVGSAEVVARCEGQEARAQVKVNPASVASLAIKQPDPLEVGGRSDLAVILKDARGNLLTGREVKWTSSSPSIATVTPAGHLTAVSAGTARIAAESEGKSGTVAVTVKAAPAAVTVERKQTIVPSPPVPEKAIDAIPTVVLPTPQSPPRDPGTIHFAPPVIPPKPQPKPAPALPSTAEHPVPAPPSGGKGKLIGALIGLALLAGVGFMVLRPKPDPVLPPAPPPPVSNLSSAVASVTIAGEDGPISVGRTRQLAALLKDATGAELGDRLVAWTSSDPSVAEVSNLGAVTAHKAGTATISATSEGKKDEFGVVVEETVVDQPAAVAQLTVTGGGKTVDPGQTVELGATLKDARGNALIDRTVVWSSADPRIATVSSSGVVTAVGAGQTVISASSEGRSGEARIAVNKPKEIEKPPAPVVVAVAKVALIAPANPSVAVGEVLRLSAQPTDGEGTSLPDRQISWKSGDEDIARVGPDGSVTGVAKGTATITVTSEGKTSSLKVSVIEATVPVSAVMLSTGPRTLKVGESAPWAASARDAKGKDMPDRTVTWSSSAPRIASVDARGVITAVAVGTAEIMATSEGKTASAPITITAPPVAVVTPPVVTPPSGGGNPPPAAGNSAVIPRKAIEAGAIFACGINASGAVCWGDGFSGLTAVNNTAGLTGLTAGQRHACGLVSGGHAVCWGDNRFGQLGDGSLTSSLSAGVAVGGDFSFSEISTGSSHTCGLAGGKAYCWGRNKDGQVGDGSTTDRKKPVAVKGGKTFVALSAGGKHTCGLTASGQAYCWGEGFSGQLGFGNQESQQEPIDVSGNSKFTRISAGGQHTCALTAAGKAYCWGGNDAGQVGDGSKSDRSAPVAVDSKVTFDQISAGDSHTCALTSGGDAYCWGENKTSQLGDGSKSNRDHPVAAGGGMSFSTLSAGEGITCGMSRSQGPVCWGRNEKSQLGDGGTAASGSPVVVRP